MPNGFIERPQEDAPVQEPTGPPKAPQGRPGRSPFSAPIPGESLTSEPKNMAFERPPEFTKLEDATEFVWHRLTQPRFAQQTFAQLEKGAPVEAVVRPILFGGFATGKWTPDLAMLMYPAVMMMIQRFNEIGEFNNALTLEEFGRKKKPDASQLVEKIQDEKQPKG